MIHEIDILKRMSRRSISLHITPGGKLEVRAPHLVPLFIINRFIASKSDWIEKAKLATKAKTKTPKIIYKEGAIFSLGGKRYALHITQGNAIVLTGSTMLFPQKFLSRASHFMEVYCRVFAKKFLSERLALYAKKMAVQYKKITIRDTSTRWGSCSSSGTISFSYRLILADLSIIDYVVMHELAHTVHHHHKLAFWNFLGKFYPNYRSARTWLQKEGHTLRI